MPLIEIDGDIYDFLKNNADAFVESTPNMVLRRLLLNVERSSEPPANPTESKNKRSVQSSKDFVLRCWQAKFTGQPRIVPPYSMMMESDADVVYFENFNKGGRPHLWYRLNAKPLATMRSKNKLAWVCLTVPPENFGYLIPLQKIDTQVKSCGWSRPHLEVNINPNDSRWGELDWGLDGFKFSV